MTNKTSIRTIALYGFRELVSSFGADPNILAHQCNIPYSAFESENDFIPFEDYSNLLELAANTLDRPSFGIELASSLPPEIPSLGPIMYLSHFAKTPRQWFNLASRYLQFHNNAMTLEQIEIPEKKTVLTRSHYDPRISHTRQVAIYNATIITRIGRDHLGTEMAKPTAVRFMHSEPQDRQLYDDIFDCDIQFDSQFNEVEADLKLLDYQIGGKFAVLTPIIDYYLQHKMARENIEELTTKTKISLIISSILGTGRCDLKNVAHSIDMNTKALQRSLEHEGTTFSEVLEEIRQLNATRLLSESNASITQIAGFLDYGSVTAFSYAFKRWLDMSPREFRQFVNGQQ